VSSVLHRIAVFSARHRALVIGVWLVLPAGLAVATHAAGTKYSSSAEVGGSDSQAANDVMARSFSPQRSDDSTVLPSTALGDLSVPEAEEILDAAQAPAEGSGVQVEAGGQLGQKLSKPGAATPPPRSSAPPTTRSSTR
jgi:hypothetical protein